MHLTWYLPDPSAHPETTGRKQQSPESWRWWGPGGVSLLGGGSHHRHTSLDLGVITMVIPSTVPMRNGVGYWVTFGRAGWQQ